MDGHRGLAVFEGGEFLCAGGGDGGVARYDFFGQPAVGFESERQRGYVQEQPVAAVFVAGEYVGLHGRAQCDDLVGVEVVERGLAEIGGDGLLDVGHTGRAADHDHAFDVGFGHARVFECLFDGLYGFLDELSGQVLKFLAGDDCADAAAV